MAVVGLVVLGFSAQVASHSYTVIEGDTLSQISERIGVSMSVLIALNDLANPDVIAIGQELLITDEVQVSSEAPTHLVAPGETLAEIAATYGVEVDELVRLNDLADPDLIQSGARLVVGAQPVHARVATTYEVVAGDTLGQIAIDLGVSLNALIEANSLASPDLIEIGTVLTVPGTSTSVPSDTVLIDNPTEAPGPSASEGGGPVRSDLPQSIASDPERLALVPVFEREAQAHDVPVDLLMALTYVESGWQPGAVSSIGAIGIGQLLPGLVDFTNEELLGEQLGD